MAEAKLPAVKLILGGHVLDKFRNPYTLKNEIARCKTIDLSKVKFAQFMHASPMLVIATDDKTTHQELMKPWPLDAFSAGVKFHKPRESATIHATAHSIPVEIDINSEEVAQELMHQGVISATRRINGKTQAPTEFVSLIVKSKDALQTLLSNKLKLAFTKFKVSINEKVIQCFKCQKVGHTAAQCTNPTTCLRCGDNHSHKECSASTTLKCANCSGPHAACSRACPALKTAAKQTKQATSTEPGRSWSSVVDNPNRHPSKNQPTPTTNKQNQPQTPTTTQVQQLIDQAIESKIKPIIERLINLTTELTLLLSHREVFSLPNVVKLNTASQHINNATQYNINQEAILQSVRSLICNAIQTDQAVTHSQLNQQPAQPQNQQPVQPQSQQPQQAKRRDRSPSPPSISDLTISDPNNTNMDIENSALETPINNSSIIVSKTNNNNKDNGNKDHHSSKPPRKQQKQPTSTLFNKTIAQSNKETPRNNV